MQSDGFCLHKTTSTCCHFLLIIAAIIQQIPEQTHSKVLLTDEHLRVKGVENVWAMGDCATIHQSMVTDHMMDLFTRFDTNGDQELSLEEFQAMMAFAIPKYSQLAEYARRVNTLFEEADTSKRTTGLMSIDKDDMLQLSEFKEMVKKVDSKVTTLPATAQCASQQGTARDFPTREPSFTVHRKAYGQFF